MISFRYNALWLVGTLATLSSLATTNLAFTTLVSTQKPSSSIHSQQLISGRSQVNLFGGLFGEDDASSAGPPTVFELKAKDVKVGALRFLLQIYLVGIQNEPSPKSWLTRQGDDGTLMVYFQDGTGMLSLELEDYGIKATRNGEKPSLQYMLQESVLVHGILDELNNVANEVEDIEAEKRLLVLSENDAIDKARETLPARKA